MAPWSGGLRTAARVMGPAFLVSVAYMDPGNWAVSIEAGSRFGYQLVWVVVLSNLIAIQLQTLAARLGLVTGKNLAQVCRESYPRSVCVLLWALSEVSIVALDATMVVGTAVGLNMLFKLPLLPAILATSLDGLLLLLLVPRRAVRSSELFTVGLLALVVALLGVDLALSRPKVAQVVGGLVPRLQRDSVATAVSIVGANVMPHSFFLHSALVAGQARGQPAQTLRGLLWFNALDVACALGVALVINVAILLVSAATFHQAGIVVQTLQSAHDMMEQTLSSSVAPAAFGAALLCAGQLSTFTGTIAGQVVLRGFMNVRVSTLTRRLLTRMAAILPAAVLQAAYGDRGIYKFLLVAQVVLALQLPFTLVPLIKATSSTRLMGPYRNSTLTAAGAWGAGAAVFVANVLLFAAQLAPGAAFVPRASRDVPDSGVHQYLDNMAVLAWNNPGRFLVMVGMMVAAAVLLSLQLWMVVTPLRGGGPTSKPLLALRAPAAGHAGVTPEAGVEEEEWRHDEGEWDTSAYPTQHAHHRHHGHNSRHEAERQVEMTFGVGGSAAAAAAAAAAVPLAPAKGWPVEELPVEAEGVCVKGHHSVPLLPEAPLDPHDWQLPPPRAPPSPVPLSSRVWLFRMLFGRLEGQGPAVRAQATALPRLVAPPAVAAAAATRPTPLALPLGSAGAAGGVVEGVPDSWDDLDEDHLPLLPSPAGSMGAPGALWAAEGHLAPGPRAWSPYAATDSDALSEYSSQPTLSRTHSWAGVSVGESSWPETPHCTAPSLGGSSAAGLWSPAHPAATPTTSALGGEGATGLDMRGDVRVEPINTTAQVAAIAASVHGRLSKSQRRRFAAALDAFWSRYYDSHGRARGEATADGGNNSDMAASPHASLLSCPHDVGDSRGVPCVSCCEALLAAVRSSVEGLLQVGGAAAVLCSEDAGLPSAAAPGVVDSLPLPVRARGVFWPDTVLTCGAAVRHLQAVAALARGNLPWAHAAAAAPSTGDCGAGGVGDGADTPLGQGKAQETAAQPQWQWPGLFGGPPEPEVVVPQQSQAVGRDHLGGALFVSWGLWCTLVLMVWCQIEVRPELLGAYAPTLNRLQGLMTDIGLMPPPEPAPSTPQQQQHTQPHDTWWPWAPSELTILRTLLLGQLAALEAVVAERQAAAGSGAAGAYSTAKRIVHSLIKRLRRRLLQGAGSGLPQQPSAPAPAATAAAAKRQRPSAVPQGQGSQRGVPRPESSPSAGGGRARGPGGRGGRGAGGRSGFFMTLVLPLLAGGAVLACSLRPSGIALWADSTAPLAR